MNIVYRKMQNGKEFMKIIDKTQALSVLSNYTPQKEPRPDCFVSHRILFSSNSVIIRDYFDDHISMPSSKEEFENACKVAVDVMTNALLQF